MPSAIDRLRIEADQLKARLANLTVLIERYEQLEREAERLVGQEREQTPSAVAPANVADRAKPVDAPPKQRLPASAATPFADYEAALRDILLAAEKPMRRKPLYIALTERGITLPGADGIGAFTTRLYRAEWIVNLQGWGYWLADRPFEPAAYAPPGSSLEGPESQPEEKKPSELDLSKFE